MSQPRKQQHRDDHYDGGAGDPQRHRARVTSPLKRPSYQLTRRPVVQLQPA
jgi:hypothetical protein